MSLIAEVSFGSLLKKGEELCGDKVMVSESEEGVTAILADGLGSGVKANILATLTSSIIKIMIEGGAPISEVVETLVNTLPVCKERKLAYCTFTIIRINSLGLAHIVEYDNPEVIIIRKGKELILEKEEMLLHGKRIKECSLQLLAGDVCFAMSDGVAAAGLDNKVINAWKRENIVTFLEKNQVSGKSAFLLKKQIITECDERYMGEIGDDSTVMVCKMERPKRVNLMVGPPRHKKDDERTVKEFMELYGTHIICGGKTAQIVSRITGKELALLRSEKIKGIPPMSFMDGIDLITEGAVTLGNAVELLEKVDQISFREFKEYRFSEDGAKRMLWELLNSGHYITLFFGNGENPAHLQKNNISPGKKRQDAFKLCDLLCKQGKVATLREN